MYNVCPVTLNVKCVSCTLSCTPRWIKVAAYSKLQSQKPVFIYYLHDKNFFFGTEATKFAVTLISSLFFDVGLNLNRIGVH